MTQFVRFSRSSESFSFETPDAVDTGNAFLPSVAIVPFRQHTGVEPRPTVTPGERVREGQLIARGSGIDSCNVHAPIPGIVKRFRTTPLPDGTMGQAAEIALSGSFDILGRKEDRFLWQKIPASEVLKILEEKGIVNTFGIPSPLAAVLRHLRKERATSVVLQLFDPDPTCKVDSALAGVELDGILVGTAILAGALDAKNVFIVHEGPAPAISPDNGEHFRGIAVRTLQSDGRYPSGLPENLLALVRRQGDSRDDAPVLFVDPVTALAARDAVVRNEPMMTRYVHVSGPSIVTPSLLKARIGTTIGDIIEECGGFSSAPSRIIVNGLVSGTALYDLDTPITKTTKSLHIMDSDTCPDYEVHPCIHCGSCLRVCPVMIDPMKVVTAIRKERFSKGIRESVDSCQSCGCCAIVCPSRIPLHHIIREARTRVPKGGKE